jgi:hypothetical protein
MAENTITGLVPDIYEALDVVSRELTGFIPAVTMSASAQRAALNQTIRVDVEPASGAGSTITPAMTIPEPTEETSGYTDIVITNAKAYEFGFIGEHQKGLNTGPGYGNVRASKIAQRIRRLVNDVETDLAALHATTSRAYGTAGATPFATAADFTDASFTKKILLDNGSPEFDNHLIMNTTAGATLTGKQAAANVAGTDSIQRQGILLPLAGLDLRQSAQVVDFTKGAMASATTTAAALTVGQTVIPLATAGTGVVAAGDIITIANDTNKYVITAVSFAGANPASGDTITIGAPGIRVAQTSAAYAITVVASSARNMVFNRSAIVLAARAPARPEEGDMAEDVMMVTDTRSGLTFEFSMYKGYRKVRYEVALAWGVKNIKPEHTAILLG